MRYTQTTLKKLEDVFNELDYTVRYEKGNFQSGYFSLDESQHPINFSEVSYTIIHVHRSFLSS